MANPQEIIMTTATDLYNGSIDLLTHAPSPDVRTFVGIGIGATVFGVGKFFANKTYNKAEEEAGADFTNYDLAEETFGPFQEDNEKAWLSPTTNVIAGAGLILAHLIGHPTAEATIVDSNVNTVIVNSTSSSMRYTDDMGGNASRFDAAIQSLEKSDYMGKLGYVESGADSRQRTAPTNNWKSLVESFKTPTTDQNGGDLVDAMKNAAGALPVDPIRKNHVGNIIVISDGIIDVLTSSKDKISAEAKVLKEEGINVKIVVTGTDSDKANYTLPGATIVNKSNARPDLFSDFGGENIISATNTDQIVSAVQDNLESSSTSHEKQDWNWLKYGGVAFFVFGTTRMLLERIRKI